MFIHSKGFRFMYFFSYVVNLIVFVIGCVNGINPHLSELVPFLITSLGDKKVRVFRFVFIAVGIIH